MKQVAVFTLVALTAAAFGAIAEGLTPTRKADDLQTQALRAQVADLQQRLTALEARVDEINRPKMQKAAP